MQPTRTNSDTSKDLWGDLMEISVGMEYRSWTDWIAVMPRNQRDNDLAKGALEQEDSLQHGNNSLRGELIRNSARSFGRIWHEVKTVECSSGS